MENRKFRGRDLIHGVDGSILAPVPPRLHGQEKMYFISRHGQNHQSDSTIKAEATTQNYIHFVFVIFWTLMTQNYNIYNILVSLHSPTTETWSSLRPAL